MGRRRNTVDIRAMLSVVEAAPMSRADIARAMGVSRATVTRLANGERGTHPTFETVDALKALHERVTARVLTTVNK